MRYELRLDKTVSGVGVFDCFPESMPTPPEALAHVKKHPGDEFMRKFVIRMMGEMEHDQFEGLVRRALAQDPPEFQAILYEACLMHDKFNRYAMLFTGRDLAELAGLSPLVFIRAGLAPEISLHQKWMRLFRANMTEHKPMPVAIASGFERPVADAASPPPVSVAEVHTELAASATKTDPVPLAETIERAKDALEKLGIFASPEMRHESSLSPAALMRRWHMAVSVRNGDLDYEMFGVQNSYGKGLALEEARASLYMEIVERVASFASFSEEGLAGRSRPYPLVRSTFETLRAEGRAAVHPDEFRLEAPYRGEELNWIEATDGAGRPVLVPVQLCFLFVNLDEPALTSGLDSTGLASGNSPAQARVTGLSEVIERDAEAIMPYVAEKVFRLTADDPQVAGLLADYESRSIQVMFQDVTTEFGVPCYKAFVVNKEGEVVKGTAAKLSGPKAALSALLEVGHPYPKEPADGQGTMPAPEGLPVRRLEELPDFSTGDWETDLKILETTLERNGYQPLHLDLTRADMNIPVVRSFVPGLELSEDFSAYSRVSPRLYANFRRFFLTD